MNVIVNNTVISNLALVVGFVKKTHRKCICNSRSGRRN